MSLCPGHTAKGVQCKRIVKNGGYCCNHVSQLHEFYENAHGWPRMSSVTIELNHRIVWMPEFNALISYLMCHYAYSVGNCFRTNIYGLPIYSPVYDKPFCFLLCCETLLRYRKEVINNHKGAVLLRDCIRKFGNDLQAPKKYLDHFLAKTDPVTHSNAIKKVVFILLGRTVLCNDCIKHIISFL